MKAASLTSSLLARKGSASPAELALVPASMRRNGNGNKPPEREPARQTCAHTAEVAAAKTGGHDCLDGFANGPYTAKFTLRLDRERHLRLKLLAAHLHLSAQEMLVEALDAYLEEAVPMAIRNNCTCLAQLEDSER